MKAYFDKLKHLINNEAINIYVIPIVIILFTTSVFGYFLLHADNESHSVTTQLNAVQRTINQIPYHNQNPENFNKTLSSINNNLTSLEKSADQSAKSSDINKITAKTDVIKQNIDDLKQLVAQSNNGKEYLDAKALPFKVISVDVISEQPFVSIDYQHQITPLGIGDTVSGWQIVSADYDTETAEFKNSKGQFIKVNLQG